MELLETQDPVKRKLIETSDRHKKELQKEVKAITDKSERALKNVLIIGGSLALAYFVISQVSSSRKNKKSLKTSEETDATENRGEITEPSFISKIGTQVINQATFILLELAKEKLAEYLQAKNEKESSSKA
jgi:hypothetical protein